MNVVGERVVHKQFGEGTVAEMEGSVIRVSFEGHKERKAFVYPDAFRRYLSACSPALREETQRGLEAREELARRQREERRTKRERQMEEERLAKLLVAKRKRRTTKNIGAAKAAKPPGREKPLQADKTKHV